MSQSFEELVEKRRRWVQINKENNFHASIKNLLTELYPDNAHFIYELLQNAEDAQASTVLFTLYSDRLIFEHDGRKLFTLDDIESITSIGSSTKVEEYNKIGKFGVGFKAVFSYTDTPRIYSGNYKFKINEMVVPERICNIDKQIDSQKTTFVLPFNSIKKPQEKAVDEIEKGLKNLDGNCLLFLNNISSIQFVLPDGEIGILTRNEMRDKKIEIETYIPQQETSKNFWMRYQDEINVIEENKNKKCQISIAYKIEKTESKKTSEKDLWKIVPLSNGKVFIYFPAEKEYSGLKFHIHAPFASTVARDSIKSCNENNQIRDGIANLVVRSCIDIRDKGILDPDFVSVLPNNNDELQNFYAKIREKILRAFQQLDLTPTRSKEYAPANNLYTGPQKIKNIIDDDILSFVTGKEKPLWATSPSSDERSKDFFSSLYIEEWGYRELFFMFMEMSKEGKKEKLEQIISTFKNKTIFNLYECLYNYLKKEQESEINLFSNVRLYDDEEEDEIVSNISYDDYIVLECIKEYRLVKVKYKNKYCFVVPDETYLISENNDDKEYEDIKFVVKETYINSKEELSDAQRFLKLIGIKKYDKVEQINLLLANESKDINKHIENIKKIIQYYKECQDIENFKRNIKILSIAKDENGILQNVYSAFDEVYIDTPYLNTYLSNIENIHRKNKLSPIYKEKLNKEEVNTFIKILIENSVFYRLDITRTSIYKRDYKHKMRYQYNGRTTCYQINQDYSIEFIDEYLNLKSILVSKMIWNLLIRASSDMGIARYRPNASCGIEEQDSQLVYKLRENAWIPSRSGEFMFPKDMTKKLLRDDFKYDDSNGLLTAIGFAEIYNKSEKKYLEEQQKAKDEGFSSLEDKKNMFEFYNFMKEKKLSFENIKAIIEKKYEFPKNNITNKERRYEKIEQDYNQATDKKYEVVKESIRITNNKLRPGVLMRLKNEYTNLNDEMICQICKKVMPFKKRDGNYYFEAVELLSKEYFHKEYSAQYLALCPVCAAKYKEFVKRQKQIMEQLYKTILNADNLEIPVILGDEHQTISFVETHFHDLKMILSTITN